MIASDWRLAKLALQVIAEEGPGIAAAEEQAREDRDVRALAQRYH